jgi:hypothetical protein
MAVPGGRQVSWPLYGSDSVGKGKVFRNGGLGGGWSGDVELHGYAYMNCGSTAYSVGTF